MIQVIVLKLQKKFIPFLSNIIQIIAPKLQKKTYRFIYIRLRSIICDLPCRFAGFQHWYFKKAPLLQNYRGPVTFTKPSSKVILFCNVSFNSTSIDSQQEWQTTWSYCILCQPSFSQSTAVMENNMYTLEEWPSIWLCCSADSCNRSCLWVITTEWLTAVHLCGPV